MNMKKQFLLFIEKTKENNFVRLGIHEYRSRDIPLETGYMYDTYIYSIAGDRIYYRRNTRNHVLPNNGSQAQILPVLTSL
jgi:hypothetical protein